MTEYQRLGAWGWFVRAFAAGFGAMFGVMVAGVFACAAYALLAVGIAAVGSMSWSATPKPAATPVPTPPPLPYTSTAGPNASPYNANGYGTPATFDPYASGTPYGSAPAYPTANPYNNPPGSTYVPPRPAEPEAAEAESPATAEATPVNAEGETAAASEEADETPLR